VLITTRSSQVEIGHLIYVTKLKDIRDSLEILSHTSRRKGLMCYGPAGTGPAPAVALSLS
jgi:hypothetical protein